MLTETQAPTLPTARRPLRLPARPSCVLVADDEHLVAMDLVARLTALGYAVVGPAAREEEAVAMARAKLPDLALLDIRMPGGDGLSGARTLLNDLGIPSIIISAYSDEDSVRQARDSAVFAYLVKPVDTNQLRVTLEIAWDRYVRFSAEREGRELAERRLAERKMVERAKWLLIERTGIDEPTAMRLLQQYARNHNERLVNIARRVVLAGGHPPESPAPAGQHHAGNARPVHQRKGSPAGDADRGG